MRSYHDDLVMALAIGCWVRDTALEIDKKDLEYKVAMINSFKIKTQGFQSTIPGMIGHKSDGFSEETMTLKKQYEEFVWLIKG
jgi:hypothetical protein